MFISICIPTYNSGEKLERLLNSIRIQTFKHYEIIISDDSRNDSVKEIIDTKYADLNIKYFKNEIALGTPNNWNNAVEKSSGDWINLMHHDDWFTKENSLQQFAEVAENNKNKALIFCAFENFYLDKGTQKKFFCSWFEIALLQLNYLNLFKTFMPNPSCTLVNKSYKPYKYDKTFKWLIDFDFYTTLFKKNHSFKYINNILVNVGMHSEQVTASVFQNAAVEIPESMALLDKHGVEILKNIFVYDFYWRLYRNINIRSMQQFNSYLQNPCSYDSIKNMIEFQGKINTSTLKVGVISKLLMCLNYLKNYF